MARTNPSRFSAAQSDRDIAAVGMLAFDNVIENLDHGGPPDDGAAAIATAGNDEDDTSSIGPSASTAGSGSGGSRASRRQRVRRVGGRQMENMLDRLDAQTQLEQRQRLAELVERHPQYSDRLIQWLLLLLLIECSLLRLRPSIANCG